MTKLLVLLAVLGWGGYKLHRKTERWLQLLRPLLGSPAAGADRGGGLSGEPDAVAPDRSLASPRVRKWLFLGLLYALALVGLVKVGYGIARAVSEGGVEVEADSLVEEGPEGRARD